jgi:hypothetical protein
MKTLEKQTPLIKVKDDIFIYIRDEVYLKFINVFQFPGDTDVCIGHLKIWEDKAPFYIIFERDLLEKLSIKGYKNCLFIPNSFKQEFDKNYKMFLRCVKDNGNCYLNYHPITCIDNIRTLVNYRNEGRMIYVGFPQTNSKLSTIGEALEIIKLKP